MPWLTLLKSDTLCWWHLFIKFHNPSYCSEISPSSVLGKVEGSQAPDFLVHLLRHCESCWCCFFPIHCRKLLKFHFKMTHPLFLKLISTATKQPIAPKLSNWMVWRSDGNSYITLSLLNSVLAVKQIKPLHNVSHTRGAQLNECVPTEANPVSRTRTL